MKKISTLLCLTLFALGLFAQNVDLSKATSVASQFFNSKVKSLVTCAKTITDGNDALLYIFNADNAFVVVSGDMRMPAVLAYCDNLYIDNEVIAPVQMWLDFYQRQISALKREERLSIPVNTQWLSLERGESFRVQDSVDPLLCSKWDQGKYFNYYCPKDLAGDNGRVVTGCVATAMAQLIYYFRFPETGVGSYSYVDENYGLQSANYGETTYDYSAMCDAPITINAAISRLIYDFGVGVDMHYGVNGSGMYNHSAARVLRTFFKYNPQTEYLFRDSANLSWDSVIVSHLDRRIPMYYAGWDIPNISGHGFICDGYQDIGSHYYFHFNFGWGGSGDGYFYTNQLTFPSYHFNFAQELIVNAYPDTTQYTYPAANPTVGETTLTAPSGSFVSTMPMASQNACNVDYTWKIIPEADNRTSTKFDISYEIAEGDTAYVWAPGDAGFAPRVYTANSGTVMFYAVPDEIDVRYVSHSTEPGFGLRVNYQAKTINFCISDLEYSTPSGVINDGSEDDLYNSFSRCKYTITVPNYSAIVLHVDNLDLEEGRDFLHIYKTSLTNNNFLTSLTGHLADTTLIFDNNKLILLFESDEAHNDEGFNLSYQAGYAGIGQFDELDISVYPNPATDKIYVTSNGMMDRISIFDMAGRELRSMEMDDFYYEVSVSDLPEGIYFLRIWSDHQVLTKKVVKK